MASRNGMSVIFKHMIRSPIGGQYRSVFSTDAANEMRSQIDKLVKTAKVVVFMKGDPQQPRCGFSNAVVQVLRMHGVQYTAHDVLSSEEMRRAIKEYTSWPTIPQIFIDGEFIGGCDILLEKHQNGELIDDLKKIGIKSALLESEVTKDNDKK